MPRVRFASFGLLAALAITVGCGKKDDPPAGGSGGGPADGQPLVLARSEDDKKEAAKRLTQIGLAFHNYHDSLGTFPAGFVAPKGQLGLSWRVAILPYIEEPNLGGLYKQFKLDEPWDSEHNKKLIAKMPKVFESPGTVLGNGKTFLRSFSGPAAFIPLTPTGQKTQPFFTPWSNQPAGSFARARRITEITDGTSNTLMVVEAAEAVEWTKPDDLMFLDPPQFATGPEKPGPLPKLGLPSEAGFHGLLCDGSVRFFPDSLGEKTVRALITVNGGEVVTLSPPENGKQSGGPPVLSPKGDSAPVKGGIKKTYEGPVK